MLKKLAARNENRTTSTANLGPKECTVKKDTSERQDNDYTKSRTHR